MAASQLLPAPHLHLSAGQQTPQDPPELLFTPPTAQAPQQAPRALHHMQTPSYPAGLSPHLPSTPRQLHRSGKSSRPLAYDHSRQAKSDSNSLQLLTGSSPIRSAHELLARLRSANIAEAMPTAARMRTQVLRRSSGRLPQTPACGVLSHQEAEATSAPTVANQSMLNGAMSDSPSVLTQASWLAALKQNEAEWKERRSRPTLKRAAPCHSGDAGAGKKARAFAVGHDSGPGS